MADGKPRADGRAFEALREPRPLAGQALTAWLRRARSLKPPRPRIVRLNHAHYAVARPREHSVMVVETYFGPVTLRPWKPK